MEQLQDLRIMRLFSWNIYGLLVSSARGAHGAGVTDVVVGEISAGTVDILCSLRELSS